MRGLLVAVCWVLVGTGVVASAGRAAEPAASPTPQEVVRQFVAAVDARDAAAAPCRFLTADLRDLFGVPGWAGLPAWLPETYSDEGRQRACDVFVAVLNGYVDSGGVPVWERTEADPATVVEQTETLAHLKVPVRRVYDDDGEPLVRSETADVFLRLESGGWRLVWPSLLWELSPDRRLGPAPTNLAGVGTLLDALAREAGARRAEDRRLVDGYLRGRVRVETEPLPWSGPHSGARDRLNDVRVHQGQLLDDQAAAPGDLREAALRTGDGTVAFELRFRARVPGRLGVSFDLRQGGPYPGRPWRWSENSAHWSATVNDGWAAAWLHGGGPSRPLPGVRASVVGDTLRIAFPARQVRDAVRLRRLLRWSVVVSTPAPPPEAVPPDSLVDDLPDEGERDGGIVHPAGARAQRLACTEIQEGLRIRVPAFVHAGERVPVWINNRWNATNMSDATITARGAVRPVSLGDVIDRTFHVRAPERPGRFRVTVAWRQVDDGREPRIPPCDGRDTFVVAAFPAGARLGEDRSPRVDGAWSATRADGRRDRWTVTPACVAGACSIVVRDASGKRRVYELGRRSYRRVISVRPRLTGTCTGRSDYGTGPVETVRRVFRERTIELLTVTRERRDAAGNEHATRLLRRTVVARSPNWEARENSCKGSVRELSRTTAVRVPAS